MQILILDLNSVEQIQLIKSYQLIASLASQNTNVVRRSRMSIGRSGIKNIAFVEDEDGIVEPIKDSEDNVSIRTKFDQTNPLDSTLYRGEKLTNRGVILIVSLAATIFAG